MGFRDKLFFKNCIRRPARTTALMCMSALLCFSLLAGFLINFGLKRGLNSLETRLGADIMVVPYEAVTKNEFNDMILQGATGYFYMNKSLADKVASTEGIGQVSNQLYLASLSASCCSTKVQMIGFDKSTDFVISPWLDSYSDNELEFMEVYVGHDINAFAGDTLTFYGVDVRVAGRLDETGTYMDSAVYADEETVSSLIETARENGTFNFTASSDPGLLTSCVLINVADGYTVEDVMDDINIHVRGVEAVRTGNMISDVSDKLKGITSTTGFMTALVWVLLLVIMGMAFAMISNERKKEYAVLRVAGASKKTVASVVFAESFFISIVGSVCGALVASIASFPVGNLLEDFLGVPFLLPDPPMLIALAVCCVAASVIGASLSAAFAALEAGHTDAALILRSEN